MVFKRFLKNLPIITLTTLVIVISVANYAPGTFLTGWDNTHPEFNFGLNISRNLFAVWREHRGLGSLGGLSHISQLPFQLLQALFSVFLPISAIRYFWQFLMLLMGVWGVYFFLRRVVLKDIYSPFIREVCSLLGALFYIFNLGTLQTFYVPLETFTTHFGFLPWLLLLASDYLKQDSRKTLFLFVLVNIFAMPQAFTATLFIAYFMILVVFIFGHLVIYSSGNALRRGIRILVITIAINMVWILPWLYFTFTHGSEVPNTLINRLSSEATYLENKNYASISDVLILRGPLFSITDYSLSKKAYIYLLSPWHDFLSNDTNLKMIFGLSVPVIMGVLSSLFILFKKKVNIPISKGVLLSLVLMVFVSWFFLLTDSPPFGFLFNFLRNHSSVFREAMRLPFTKFSIIAAFTYSIFFALAFYFVTRIISRIKYASIIISVLVVVVALGTSVSAYKPYFDGDLIYDNLKVNIPSSYFEMFSYLETQPKDMRILKLPVHTFWSWGFNSWGYRGSGFMWFGINQPITERAFDVWNIKNENLYREIQMALYSQDIDLFKTYLNKYDLGILLFDGSVIEPNLERVEPYMAADVMAKIQEDADFEILWGDEFLSLYKYKPIYDNYTRVYSLDAGIEEVNSVQAWILNDPVYEDKGDYISVEGSESVQYPFADIFSDYQRSFSVETGVDTIIYSKKNSSEKTGIYIPNIFNYKDLILADIVDGEGVLKIVPNLPKVYIEGDQIYPKEIYSKEIDLSQNLDEYYVVASSKVLGPLDYYGNGENRGSFFFNPSTPLKINIVNVNDKEKIDLMPSLLTSDLGGCHEMEAGYYSFIKEGNAFYLKSKSNTSCIATQIKGSLGPGLIEIDADVENQGAQTYYCLYELGDVGKCLNNKDIYAFLDKKYNDLVLQIYSEPLHTQSTSFFKGVDINYYPVFTTNVLDTDSIDATFYAGDVISNDIKIVIPKEVSAWESRYEKFDYQTEDWFMYICNDRRKYTREEQDANVIRGGFNDYLSINAFQGDLCFLYSGNDLTMNTSYNLSLSYKYSAGHPSSLCFQNDYNYQCSINTVLPRNTDWQEITYTAPSFDLDDKGVRVHVRNDKIGKYDSVSMIDNIGIDPVPGDWIQRIKIGHEKNIVVNKNLVSDRKYLQVKHNISPVYFVSDIDNSKYIALSQTYDTGWVAFCGLKKCNSEHVYYNNWGNAWSFEEPYTGKLNLVFVPALLQIVGILSAVLAPFYLFVVPKYQYRGYKSE